MYGTTLLIRHQLKIGQMNIGLPKDDPMESTVGELSGKDEVGCIESMDLDGDSMHCDSIITLTLASTTNA